MLAVIEADRDYYLATGGGVTFSGGECMLYPKFVKNIAKRCKERGISVAIDTAGAVPYSHFDPNESGNIENYRKNNYHSNAGDSRF